MSRHKIKPAKLRSERDAEVSTPGDDVLEILTSLLKRRTIDDPTWGLAPPNLATLMDRTSWAIAHPGSYTGPYLAELKDDIATAEQCLAVVRTVLSATLPGNRKTILEERMSRKRR